MTHVIEKLVALLVPLYTVHPEHMVTFWRRGAYYLQPNDADYRLIIGRSGRNLEALRIVASFAARPSEAQIEVIEPGRVTEPLPPRPMVSNADQPIEADTKLAWDLDCVLEAIGADAASGVEPSHPEELTTALSATTIVPIDGLTRRSLSILFGAIGRVRGRNVRIHLNS